MGATVGCGADGQVICKKAIGETGFGCPKRGLKGPKHDSPGQSEATPWVYVPGRQRPERAKQETQHEVRLVASCQGSDLLADHGTLNVPVGATVRERVRKCVLVFHPAILCR